MFERRISLEDLNSEELAQFVGSHDKNLKLLSGLFQANISLVDYILVLSSDSSINFTHFTKVVDLIKKEIKSNTILDHQLISYIYEEANKLAATSLNEEAIGRKQNGQSVYPKTIGQKHFVDSMKNSDIVFALGPAGTGKTYLAVILAVSMLKKNDYKRIVLTRPAVEAGESLGFLPGDLKEKVDPYLTPLYDALYEMLGQENTLRLIEKGVIEIAPLAYMRGRTLSDAFVILDEAQNTTISQMKMFLTRLGNNSKMVITGDTSQVDLKINGDNGLIDASNRLNDIENIKIVTLNVKDVVRHLLVQKIIERYEY